MSDDTVENDDDAGLASQEAQARRFGLKELVQSITGITAAALLLIFGLPWVTDTTWTQIWAQMSSIGLTIALLLVALKLLGVYSYTFTLTGSLPGLSHRRALMLNASGSMVSNLMPAGGAVAVAVTILMCRSWGFLRRNISTSLVVTGVWNIMARLALPVIAILWVLIGPVDTPAPVIAGSIVAVIAIAALLALFLGAIYSDRFAGLIGRLLGGVAGRFSRRVREGTTLDALIRDQQARWGSVVSHHGLKMSLGLGGMLGSFFLLYLVACQAVGIELAIAQLFAAYAIRQMLTVLAVTPGGLGITEAGTAAVLIAFGADPASAAAAALLYAVFTHLLDVPLGATALFAWWLAPKRQAARQLDHTGHLAASATASTEGIVDDATGESESTS